MTTPEETNQKESSEKTSHYTQFVDLTSRAQEEARREKAIQAFDEPDPPLEPASVENLPEPARKACAAVGWTALTPVQEKAIPYLLNGYDMIVQAQTGSGKTGAFLLPLFEILDRGLTEPQALVLCPTRELARQIHEELSRMQPGDPARAALRSTLVYGGVKYAPQLRALKDGVHVVIGTPGRVLDLLDRRTLSLRSLRVFVLDEADEMLSMGFYPAMRKLKQYLPDKRESHMFSATIPGKVQSLAREFLTNPGFLGLSAGKESVDTMVHRYVVVDQMNKDRALIRLFEMENPDSAIIFSNTKRDVEYITRFLQNYGHDADGISGDLTQRSREEVMARIRAGTLRFLVATDVAARGIDISDLSHVFMYDVPQDQEYYIHRSGRTARAGKSGIVVVLATIEDERALLAMARRYDVALQKDKLPTEKEVEERLAERLTVLLEDRFRDKSNLERERHARFVSMVEQLAEEEPELLGMLVDEFYHEQLHGRPDATPSTAEKQPPRPKRTDSAGGRRRGGKGPRRG